MKYQINQMILEFAKKITNWKYQKPYDIYNINYSKEVMNEFLDGSYFSVTHKDKIIGYFCYGSSAQIHIREAKDKYNNSNYFDVGLGLRPDLCGRGYGLSFFEVGINFAAQKYYANNFRLTVAVFNERAIKTYIKAGFKKIDSFIRQKDNVEFYIMTLQNVI